MADYFSGSDISVFWDVGEFDKETCAGSRNVSNALEEAPTFVAKTSFPKQLFMGVLHKCHVFHFFSGDGVDDGVCQMLLGPMVISEGDGHVGSVHSVEVVLGQVAGREILRASGYPRR
jgi:hypothetical protein